MAAPKDRIPTPDFAAMSVPELIEEIEHGGYGCEGGPLTMSIAWRELKARFVMPPPIDYLPPGV